METKERISRVKSYRKTWEALFIRCFRRIILKWCDTHLNVAKETGLLTNIQLHELDAQMKGDLGFPGYPHSD